MSLRCFVVIASLLAVGLAAPIAARASGLPVVPAAGPQFFALTVRDIDASVRFYREVFGLAKQKELNPADGSYHVVILGSDRLVVELGHGKSFRESADPSERHLSPGVFKVGFYVTDLRAALSALAGRGIHPVAGPFEEDDLGIRSAIIGDNEGNEIQLFERPH